MASRLLVRLKMASGRRQDLVDVERLRKLAGNKKKTTGKKAT